MGVIVFAMSRPVSAAGAALAPASAPASAPRAPAPAPAPAPASTLAPAPVFGLAGRGDARRVRCRVAFLAGAVYSDPSLRAVGIDDAHARVLCGEVAIAAPTSRSFAISPIRWLRFEARTRRRVSFSPESLGAFRHAGSWSFASSRAAPPRGSFSPKRARLTQRPMLQMTRRRWAGRAPFVRSLRAFGPPVASVQPAPGSSGKPALATHDGPQKPHEVPPSSRPFYESTWFWGGHRGGRPHRWCRLLCDAGQRAFDDPS